MFPFTGLSRDKFLLFPSTTKKRNSEYSLPVGVVKDLEKLGIFSSKVHAIKFLLLRKREGSQFGIIFPLISLKINKISKVRKFD